MLNAGEKLGPYEIAAPIGKGGMGEVYRATDTRLRREVAIKVSGEQFSERFEREARAIAQLNHPNICTLHDVGPNYLVMEIVEGPTLAERIAEGAIPLEEAITLGRQITAALEEAHAKGITHRDLKPGNIKIKPDGTVKVLDFGLAKMAPRTASASDPDQSPTISAAATQAGIVLGTAAYMAPEQAKGRAVDKRADIWAFGVLLFEMVTGKRLFRGEDLTDTLAAVVRDKADLSAAPAELRRLLDACLQKDPKERLKDIGDVWRLLDTAPTEHTPVAALRAGKPWGWIASSALTLVAALALGAALWRASQPEERPLVRANLDLPGFIGDENLAISRDGTRIAYVTRDKEGVQRLATRLLAEKEAKILPATEGASYPFFSPDGQWIGFGVPGQVKKVAVGGGSPLKLVDASLFLGGSWSDGGFIVAAVNVGSNLVRFPESGGQPERLTGVRGGTLRFPQVLPGGRDVLVWDKLGGGSASIVSLETKQISTLIPRADFPQYLPTRGAKEGHIIFANGSTLMAVPYDPATRKIEGQPVPVLDDWAGGTSFSDAGTFLCTVGAAASNDWPLRWMRRDGTMERLLETRGRYTFPRVSPDGRRLAATLDGDIPLESRIVVYDWKNDTLLPLTDKGEAQGSAIWTPDSQYLLWASSVRNGKMQLVWKRADGSGELHTLLEVTAHFLRAESIAPDGKHLVFTVDVSDRGLDLWVTPLDLSKPGFLSAGKPQPLVQTPGVDVAGRFSPDGNWIAYHSDESGQYEIYVQPFPGPGGRRRISESQGAYPEWSSNGRELLYFDGLRSIMVVDYQVQGDAFVASRPRLWSNTQIRQISSADCWTLHTDGERIVMIPIEGTSGGAGSAQVGMLLNFFDELRRRAPVR